MKQLLPFLFIFLWKGAFGSQAGTDPSFDTTSTKSKRFVIVGSGGGFTGLVTQYYVFKNGNVFKSGGLDSKPLFHKKLSGKQACTIFKKLKSLHVDTQSMDRPGNMYYFIEEHNAEKISRITWGENGFAVSEAIRDFYQATMDSINKN